MARKKKQPVEELEELEELDPDADLEELIEDEVIEVDSSEESPPTVEGFTPKQVALQLKTDARTLRKFLRSKYGKIGQGQRWVIEEDQVDQLREEFIAWKKPAKKVEVELPPKSRVTEDESDDDPIDLDSLDLMEDPTEEDLDLIDLDELEGV